MKRITMCLLMLVMYTTGHTQVLEKFDVYPGPNEHSVPLALTAYKNKLYFLGFDATYGQEYRYTAGGTTPTFSLLQDINPNKGSDHLSTAAFVPTAVANGYLVFVTRPLSNENTQLWVYDGANPPKPADASQSGMDREPQFLTVLNNKVYYQAIGGTHQLDLFEYNPTTDTKTTMLTAAAGPNGLWTSNIVAFKGKLYFAVYQPATGVELHSYTPGLSATVLVKDIFLGTGDGRVQNLYVYNGKLFFLASDGITGLELWSYDGINPPVNVSDVNAGANDGVQFSNITTGLTGFQNAIYFAGTNGSNGFELYKYNIANNSVSLVHEFQPGAGSGNPMFMTAYKNKLYMCATDAAEGEELWIYDGISTPKMTVLYPGINGGLPFEFTEFDGDLYFRAVDSAIGRELFRIHDTTTPPDTSTYVQRIAPSKVKVTAFPNPTPNNTMLEVSLQDAKTFSITLTDVQGRTLHTIAKKQYNEGKHKILILMQELPTGIYYYRIADGNEQLAAGKLMKE